MTDASTDRADDSKLTVPQLKARCKELKISGYSKLGKTALLEKLAQHGGTASSNALSMLPPVPMAEKAVNCTNVVPSDVTLAAPQVLDPQTRLATSPVDPTLIPAREELVSDNNEQALSVKRRPDDSAGTTSPSPVPGKKQKQFSKAGVGSKTGSTGSSVKKSDTLSDSAAPKLLRTGISASRNTKENLNPTRTQKTRDCISSSRPSATVSKSSTGHFRPLVPLPKDRATSIISTELTSVEQLTYLDFGSSPKLLTPSSFESIAIPPTLVQRKRIHAWSVFLSGLSNAERRTCARVSRDFRYAVYLSAVPIITRVFGSRRFSELPQKYNMSMTNFWPYLKQLEFELRMRRASYSASFLSKFFGDETPIGDGIWGCPANDKQLAVSLRFVMTRVWFTISMNGRDRERTRNSVVVDAREIIKDEIWSITVVTPETPAVAATTETFYVLEPTCEVIGLPPASRNSASGSGSTEPSIIMRNTARSLRVDWSKHIDDIASNVEHISQGHSMLSHLKCANAEEYTGGISKLWLSRIAKEGEVGKYKKKVADRYVLACVVGNSVSGQWMASSHMAQVFAGTASESDLGPLLSKKEVQKVNLFLPAHHLIESVHFTTSGSNSQYLHPALASLQTPGREYYILRDNGMTVGCEEDGVWPVWMELLDCDARGVARF